MDAATDAKLLEGPIITVEQMPNSILRTASVQNVAAPPEVGSAAGGPGGTALHGHRVGKDLTAVHCTP